MFTPNNRAALSKVSSAGGTPEPLTSLDKQASEVTQRWPQVLPGGKAVLFTSSTTPANFEDAEIVVYSMASGQRKTLQRGGFLLATCPAGTLSMCTKARCLQCRSICSDWRSPASPRRSSKVWFPIPPLPRRSSRFQIPETLAYVAGSSGGQNVSVYWMDREGKFTPLRETPGDYRNPAFSPDGKRLALEINDGSRSDIWVYEWERDTLTRLTFAGEGNGVSHLDARRPANRLFLSRKRRSV